MTAIFENSRQTSRMTFRPLTQGVFIHSLDPSAWELPVFSSSRSSSQLQSYILRPGLHLKNYKFVFRTLTKHTPSTNINTYNNINDGGKSLVSIFRLTNMRGSQFISFVMKGKSRAQYSKPFETEKNVLH